MENDLTIAKTIVDFYDINYHKERCKHRNSDVIGGKYETLRNQMNDYVFSNDAALEYFFSKVSPDTHQIHFIESPWLYQDISGSNFERLLRWYSFEYNREQKLYLFGTPYTFGNRVSDIANKFVCIRAPEQVIEVVRLSKRMLSDPTLQCNDLTCSLAFLMMYAGQSQLSVDLWKSIKDTHQYQNGEHVQSEFLTAFTDYEGFPPLPNLPTTVFSFNAEIPMEVRALQHQSICEVIQKLQGVSGYLIKEGTTDLVELIEVFAHTIMRDENNVSFIKSITGMLYLDNSIYSVLKYILSNVEYEHSGINDALTVLEQIRRAMFAGNFPPYIPKTLPEMDESEINKINKLLKIYIRMTHVKSN